ncbi:MAG: prepilin-type N-terminal cleavage/methylation domain-containing protein [Lachnospiraceae bacterium]|nr:prepilin-type N-terminal cleavage/methylation domain-containing protein [Lachnospiraceae bacterium]MDD3615028.1 prepilin-type N-terminal cleavage/methylation domain-containing protein [Lachnospiraceae bacterium]
MFNLKKRLKENKGFTLAELLIVVAIIAVLVAVSIPIFTTQLEKSRDAVSIANIRAAYAEASTSALTESSNGATVTYTAKTETTPAQVTVTGVLFKGTQSGWSSLETELPFTYTALTDAAGGEKGTYTLVFQFADADGACTLNSISK